MAIKKFHKGTGTMHQYRNEPKLSIFEGMVRTIADIKLIRELKSALAAATSKKAAQTIHHRLSMSYYRGTNPTFSFVSTVDQPVFNEKRQLVASGLGMFRCKQTNQLVEKRFVPSSYILKGRSQAVKKAAA